MPTPKLLVIDFWNTIAFREVDDSLNTFRVSQRLIQLLTSLPAHWKVLVISVKHYAAEGNAAAAFDADVWADMAAINLFLTKLSLNNIVQSWCPFVAEYLDGNIERFLNKPNAAEILKCRLIDKKIKSLGFDENNVLYVDDNSTAVQMLQQSQYLAACTVNFLPDNMYNVFFRKLPICKGFVEKIALIIELLDYIDTLTAPVKGLFAKALSQSSQRIEQKLAASKSLLAFITQATPMQISLAGFQSLNGYGVRYQQILAYINNCELEDFYQVS